MLKRKAPIRVVVVDDSPTVRELLVTLLHRAEGIQVVGIGSNGEDAVRLTKRLRPDVVTMDVIMPRTDGLEATRRIMREAPTPIVIVTASLMRDDLDLAFEALRVGALTALRKPGLADPETCDKVVQAVRLMAEVPVVHHWGRWTEQPIAQEFEHPPAPPRQPEPEQSIQMIGIASSTGGPAALVRVLGALPADYAIPILAVQHVTRGFAIGLADWLNGETALRVGLAGHGETPQPGTVLLAPDDYHIQVNVEGVVELSREPPYRGLRPSANQLFHSLARAYGPQATGIVLTGMGDDGADGIEALHRAGGLTLAQNEESCVVYGMPHQAVLRNAVDHVLPPEQIATTLGHLAQNGKR